MKIDLPAPDGSLQPYRMSAPRAFAASSSPAATRSAYAAAHVVADPLGSGTELDWEATLAFRRHLWSHGLGVAEAMDTAQRGMGLAWPETRELIRRTGAAAREFRRAAAPTTSGGLESQRYDDGGSGFQRRPAGTLHDASWHSQDSRPAGPGAGRLVCGAGTDQLPPGAASLGAIIAAYEEQLAVIEEAGAGPVIMASRHLAASASGPDDYLRVYRRLLGQVSRPAILHWLGPMFDPALTGYWGSADLDEAAETVLAIIGEHAAKVDGIKVSLLDADREVALRRRLPDGVRMYTGDDFNYPDLIRGDAPGRGEPQGGPQSEAQSSGGGWIRGGGRGYSDALLGVFDPIAAPASAAMRALDDGDLGTYDEILAPTIPLARHLFSAPTYLYKTGVVFLAWLAGHQGHFRMVGGYESARPVPHLVELFKLADAAGLFPDPDLAASRMRAWLEVNS